MALVDVLRKAGVEQADFLREDVRVLAQGECEPSPAPIRNESARPVRGGRPEVGLGERVAAGVGEGSAAVRSVHQYLAFQN